MAEYIDLDTPLEVYRLRGNQHEPIATTLRELLDFNKIPYITADVQPVRHGRWVKARGSWCTPGGDPVWECSECGKGTHVYGIEHGTYGSGVADGQWVACPNCGARLDLEADDGK